MRILYFDAPMGISGDMFLASLIDLGVDSAMIMRELKKLPLKGEKLDVKVGRVVRHSISARTFRVARSESAHHRTFLDIKGIINKSKVSKNVKGLSISIFKTIAVAEAKVHGITPDKVHFHEVGALDSIIDIVGAATAVDSLKIDRFVCSPVALGTGTARTMHGVLPIPAPATVEILKGVPIAASTAPFELTTPTGAAIVKTLATEFGPLPAMTIEQVGYGAGKKDFKDAANLLRILVGTAPECADATREHGSSKRLYVLETNIDDMSPELSGYLMERLLAAGAADVYFTPVQMKKSRPGVLLTVLADEKLKGALLELIFTESTSIGVRAYPVERYCLERKTVRVPTGYGNVRVKVSTKDGRIVNAQPEYEDCRARAQEKSVPLKKIMDAARAAATKKNRT